MGIGPLELVLVIVLALIFIGPGKMPEVAASVGKAIREFQRASAELTEALNSEIAAAQAEKAAQEAAANGVGHSGNVVAEAEAVAAAAVQSFGPEDNTAEATTQVDDNAQIAPWPETTSYTPAPVVGEAVSVPSADEAREAIRKMEERAGLTPLPEALLTPTVLASTDQPVIHTLLKELDYVRQSALAANLSENEEKSDSSSMVVSTSLDLAALVFGPLPDALVEPTNRNGGLSSIVEPVFSAVRKSIESAPIVSISPSRIASAFDPLPDALIESTSNNGGSPLIVEPVYLAVRLSMRAARNSSAVETRAVELTSV